MFGRLTNAKLRSAENAQAAGRLDEAFELATTSELAGHRRAGRILTRLFKPLMNRAQEHMLAGRFPDALIDLEKAARCGVDDAAVAEWRARALKARDRRERRAHDDRHALHAAERHVSAGDLTQAGHHLERVENAASRRDRLLGEIDDRAEQARRAAAEARGAMKAEQYAVAVDRLVAARRDHAAAHDVIETADELAKRLSDRIRDAIAAGRLDAAALETNLLQRLNGGRPDTAELARAMGWIKQAGAAVRGGQFDDAAALMRKVSQIAPGRWVKDVCDHLKKIDDHLSALAEGPLGLLTSGAGVGGDSRRQPAAETLPGRAKVPASARSSDVPPVLGPVGLPKRLLLRIDGVGSFLLLRGDRIVIGRMDSAADLPIRADLSHRHAEIIHAGDDYFLHGHAGVELAGAAVRRALLHEGDRIQLGRRVRMTFQRPSRKSPTALLKLGEGVRSVADVKNVILWSGPILIGSSTHCHIVARRNPSGLVLLERNGAFQLRPMPGASAHVSLPGPLAVELGRPVVAGDLSLTLDRVPEPSGPGIG
ncbi:MAG: hypothetical protein V3T70_07230 [Phycisphaerae bacterium]